MKKIIFSLGLLLVCVNSYSQKSEKNSFGAKLGLNYSSLGNSDTTGKANILVGFFGNFEINDKISLQPELQYTTFGGEYAYNGSFGSSGFSTNYKYSQTVSASSINIPVIIKYKVDNKFSIDFGPQIGFLNSNSAKFYYTYDGGTTPTTSSFNYSDTSIVIYNQSVVNSQTLFTDFKEKKVLFSFNIGAAYQLKSNFFIDARYNIGLTDFVGNGNIFASKDSSGNVIDAKYNNVTFKNSNLQLSVGYKF